MVDKKAFNAAYAQALMPQREAAFSKSKDIQVNTFAGADIINVVHNVERNFCNAWPRISGFIKLAIKYAGWASPGIAAEARAFIAAVETTVIPAVCDTTDTNREL